MSHLKLLVSTKKRSEFQAEHVEGATNMSLHSINDYLAEIAKQGDVFVHCAGGYRSMMKQQP